MKPFRSLAGFTLTELLLVIAIAGILATMALPSFKSLTESQRVKNATYEMITMLSMARSEAIKRNGDVTITPTPSWAAPTSLDIAASGVIIDTRPGPKGVKITASAPAATQVTYTRNGRTTVSAAITFEIDISGAATPSRNVRCVKVELSGMPRARTGAC